MEKGVWNQRQGAGKPFILLHLGEPEALLKKTTGAAILARGLVDKVMKQNLKEQSEKDQRLGCASHNATGSSQGRTLSRELGGQKGQRCVLGPAIT